MATCVLGIIMFLFVLLYGDLYWGFVKLLREGDTSKEVSCSFFTK